MDLGSIVLIAFIAVVVAALWPGARLAYLGERRELLERRADEVSDQLEGVYGEDHEIVPAGETDRRAHDLDYYETAESALDADGFRSLGLTVDRTNSRALRGHEAVVEVYVHETDPVVARVTHSRLTGFWARLRATLKGLPRDDRWVELVSEREGDGFLVTSDADAGRQLFVPDSWSQELRSDSIEGLVARHRVRMAQALADGAELRVVQDLDDAIRANVRQWRDASREFKDRAGLDDGQWKLLLGCSREVAREIHADQCWRWG